MLRRLPPQATDWGVPAIVAVLATIEMMTLRPPGMLAGLALEVGACLVLVGRRRCTMPACAVAGLLGLGLPWTGSELNDVSSPILILAVIAYSLARWLPGHRGLLALGPVVVLLMANYVFTDERDNNMTDVFFVLSLLSPPYVLGKVTRKLAEQSARLLDQHELVKREAVRAERERIARELHDVIAHSVSAMVVQTAAAQDLIRTDPDRAEEVLADVAAAGRQALDETGRLLHVIRDADDELGLAPAPGLTQVADLVERFRADGLDVDLAMADPAPVLPAGLDVSAYRIVQEALTNALRYGSDRRASLVVSHTGDRLRIRSSNNSNGLTGGGSGLGLLGMAERVSVLGGTLTHGVTPDGRFELDATLPVTS